MGSTEGSTGSAKGTGPRPATDRFASPSQECDLVMKGGVTSGVVYPSTILELAGTYRFRSIGGASAGAIAAATAAAAEYGRQVSPGKRGAGFEGLETLAAEIAREGFLKALFQPSAAAAPLFDAAMAFQRKDVRPPKGAGVPRQVLWWAGRAEDILRQTAGASVRQGEVVGALLAAVLSFGLFWAGIQALLAPWPWKVLGGVLGLLGLGLLWAGYVLGGLVGGGLGLSRHARQVADKDTCQYGLCEGSAGPKANLADERGLSLTDWLHVRINQLAGRGADEAPITIKELAAKGVDFKIVTCNLSLGQPYILPLKRGARSFFFKRSELARVFPPPVMKALVDWGKANRPTHSVQMSDEDAAELLRFPMGDDMPAVVATRLSLSFPVLLSAVRLYSIQPWVYGKQEDGTPRRLVLSEHLEEHWFSDGGIASNFPIHIFDAWVPTRPTFGITLYDSPLTKVLQKLSGTAEQRKVVLPHPRDFDMARPQRLEIDSMLDFLRAIFSTAQTFRDNAQSGLPSYRERIVQVFLDPDEGGLNLDMDSRTIERIMGRGKEAGQLLLNRYANERSAGLAEHRWVRLLVLMGELERQLGGIRGTFPGPGWKEGLRRQVRALMDAQLEARKSRGGKWYRDKDEAWCAEAERRLSALWELVEAWDSSHQAWKARGGKGSFAAKGEEESFFAQNPPRPQGILKVTPDL
ncbi:MAG TPA: hypothetical protein VK447_05125 [Myxococcaceae bacterium]|nr:hypothetical protein [Myxococcaceae bacterium]